MLHYFFENAWRWKCGLPEKTVRVIPGYESLKGTEWSNQFEALMRNRLIMGAIRYGLLHEKGKPRYDRVKSMIKRLEDYKKNGNKEFLVDVANLCLLEFEECDHPNAHFRAMDVSEYHVQERRQ